VCTHHSHLLTHWPDTWGLGVLRVHITVTYSLTGTIHGAWVYCVYTPQSLTHWPDTWGLGVLCVHTTVTHSLARYMWLDPSNHLATVHERYRQDRQTDNGPIAQGKPFYKRSPKNHVINWDEATVIARESDRTTRWIREAVMIRQESQGVMNRDEGAYQLHHIYDKLLLPLRTSSRERSFRRRQQLPKLLYVNE